MTMTTLTLREACERYIQNLIDRGSQKVTIRVYRRILQNFVEQIGETKDVNKLIVPTIHRFLNSDSVLKAKGKDGELRDRSEPSLLQHRRVVRQALVYWHEQGWLEFLPLPRDEMKFVVGGKDSKKADKEPEAGTELTEVTEQPELPDQLDDAIAVEGEADEEA